MITNRIQGNSIIKLTVAAILLIGAVLSFTGCKANRDVASIISLDVNPSVEIQVNEKEKVVAVTPLDEDGKKVIGDMNFEREDLDDTVDALISSMLRNGYLSELQNSILISVDGRNAEMNSKLQAEVADEINEVINKNNFSGAVLSQSIASGRELQSLADSNSITKGKAQLIQNILKQNTSYTFEQLAPLSINDLTLISESKQNPLANVSETGAASDKAYIGEAKAKEIALKHAGVTNDKISLYEADIDFEKGVLVYDIEFNVGTTEYSYDINAKTGEIVASEKDQNGDKTQGNKPGSQTTTQTTPETKPQTGNSSGYIGEARAREIALNHAGISSSNASRITSKLDTEDNVMVYDVEFHSGGYEYSYEINAKSGAIVSSDKEKED